MSLPLFSISWVYLYAGEKKGLKNGRDAFYDLFMGTPYSLFSGRKLGIEVNGAKQVNVPNFYLIIKFGFSEKVTKFEKKSPTQ